MGDNKHLARAFEKQLQQMQIALCNLHPSLNLNSAQTPLTLDWDEKLSDQPQLEKRRNHLALFGYQAVTIDAGCELLLHGPSNEQTHLYIKQLTLAAGARICLQTDSWLYIENLQVVGDGEALIELKPRTAQQGGNGVDGVSGTHATLAPQQGGNGGAASDGVEGKDAGSARKAYLKIGYLEGDLCCIASAGDGGDGGYGGNGGGGGRGNRAAGGNGGNGGYGGHGGHAASGGELYVTIEQRGTHSVVSQQTPVPRGGKGGRAGRGGLSGDGEVTGQQGLDGTTGSDGADGEAGAVYLRLPKQQQISKYQSGQHCA